MKTTIWKKTRARLRVLAATALICVSVSACARRQVNPFLGAWTVQEATVATQSADAAEIGMDGFTVTIASNGKASVSHGGQDADASYTITDDEMTLVLTDEDGTLELRCRLEDDRMVATVMGAMQLYFQKVEK